MVVGGADNAMLPVNIEIWNHVEAIVGYSEQLRANTDQIVRPYGTVSPRFFQNQRVKGQWIVDPFRGTMSREAKPLGVIAG